MLSIVESQSSAYARHRRPWGDCTRRQSSGSMAWIWHEVVQLQEVGAEEGDARLQSQQLLLQIMIEVLGIKVKIHDINNINHF